MAQFDSKVFNPEAFQKYRERIPDLKKNELLKSGAFRNRNDLRVTLSEQAGGNYVTIPMKGLLDGTPVNYDGVTDITSTTTKTFSQSMVVIGRAKAWTEKDFSVEITGTDFMSNVAEQVNKYWENIDQDTLVAILDGIFAMSGGGNTNFVNNHTLDITNESDAYVGATTLNNAIQKASGDNKNIFNTAIMHSVVATNLENLQLLQYLKYTDKAGITRDLGIATWNGRTVLIDDSIPTQATISTAGVYSVTVSTLAAVGDKISIGGKEYTFVANDATPEDDEIKVGATPTATQQATNIAAKLNAEASGLKDLFTIASSSTKVTFTNKLQVPSTQPIAVATKGAEGTLVVTNAVDTPEVLTPKYVTYLLGNGAFDYCDCGAKVPNEMSRDPEKNGGEDTLYTRQRKLFAPYGISFTKASMATLSPSDAELKNGANWTLVNDGNGTYINHKSIPIARIISLG